MQYRLGTGVYHKVDLGVNSQFVCGELDWLEQLDFGGVSPIGMWQNQYVVVISQIIFILIVQSPRPRIVDVIIRFGFNLAKTKTLHFLIPTHGVPREFYNV